MNINKASKESIEKCQNSIYKWARSGFKKKLSEAIALMFGDLYDYENPEDINLENLFNNFLEIDADNSFEEVNENDFYQNKEDRYLSAIEHFMDVIKPLPLYNQKESCRFWFKFYDISHKNIEKLELSFSDFLMFVISYLERSYSSRPIDLLGFGIIHDFEKEKSLNQHFWGEIKDMEECGQATVLRYPLPEIIKEAFKCIEFSVEDFENHFSYEGQLKEDFWVKKDWLDVLTYYVKNNIKISFKEFILNTFCDEFNHESTIKTLRGIEEERKFYKSINREFDEEEILNPNTVTYLKFYRAYFKHLNQNRQSETRVYVSFMTEKISGVYSTIDTYPDEYKFPVEEWILFTLQEIFGSEGVNQNSWIEKIDELESQFTVYGRNVSSLGLVHDLEREGEFVNNYYGKVDILSSFSYQLKELIDSLHSTEIDRVMYPFSSEYYQNLINSSLPIREIVQLDEVEEEEPKVKEDDIVLFSGINELPPLTVGMLKTIFNSQLIQSYLDKQSDELIQKRTVVPYPIRLIAVIYILHAALEDKQNKNFLEKAIRDMIEKDYNSTWFNYLGLPLKNGELFLKGKSKDVFKKAQLSPKGELIKAVKQLCLPRKDAGLGGASSAPKQRD